MSKTFRENLEDIHGELERLTEKATEIASAVEQQTSAIKAASEDITFAIGDAADQITSAVREQTALLDIRLSETNWQLSLQTKALFSIDHTLKTPTETLANEWRARAEELRRRGELKQAEHLFLRCLEPENNPLDYRTYIGLAKTYELLDEPEKALEYYEKSLRHAPKSRDRDWRSYSYLLMGLVQRALSEHQVAYTLSEKAVKLSPMYHAAWYLHARNSAEVGNKESSLSSLWRAAAASPQFLSSAMLDNHFDPWRDEVIGFLAQKNTTVNLPAHQYHRVWYELAKKCAAFEQHDNTLMLIEKVVLYSPPYYPLVIGEKIFESVRGDIAHRLAEISLKKNLDWVHYHKVWYELSKHCASFGQEENCIGLLEKVILHNPTYFDTAMAEISSFNPLQGAVQSLLHRLHADAKTRAKKSINNAERKLWSAREAVAEAEHALKRSRDNEQLESMSACESAQSKFNLARKQFGADKYEELVKIPYIEGEVIALAGSALGIARQEKEHYEAREREKVKKARGEVFSIMGRAFGYSLMASMGGCVCGLALSGGKDEGAVTGIFLAAVAALLWGVVSAAKRYKEIRGPQSPKQKGGW